MEIPEGPKPNDLTATPANSPETSKFAKILPLVVMAAVFGLFVYQGTNLTGILKVAVGLGLVIFIHELGHFLAAKFCGVRVETFSVGFGEPIPGCSFRYGETQYKIGWIPLGGYVKMLGEGDNTEGEDAEEDPRSFKNKSVGQRMLIISAGVIMNLFLAVICFIVAYSHGVKEESPLIGSVQSGSPAWKAGLHSDLLIKKIGSMSDPMFADIRPIVMSARKGEQVPVTVQAPDGTERTVEMVPVRTQKALYPVIGIAPASSLTLGVGGPNDKPSIPGFAADKVPLKPGDTIIAVRDAKGEWIDLTVTPEQRARFMVKSTAFHDAMSDLRGKEATIKVKRGDETLEMKVPPQFTRTTGMRMRMGRITAIRKDSPAANAKPVLPAIGEAGLREFASTDADSGDKIIEVIMPESAGGETVLSSSPRNEKEKPLDPMRFPDELEAWALRNPDAKTIRLTVIRAVEHEPKRLQFELLVDRAALRYRESSGEATTPLGVPGLGLCYAVDTIVEKVAPDSPAAKAGIQDEDVIKEFRTKYQDEKGNVKEGKWIKVDPNQAAFLYTVLPGLAVPEVEFKLQRGTAEPFTASLTMVPDETWPSVERGFAFETDFVTNKADSIGEALNKGANRTVRMIRVIYQNLYSMIFGQVSGFTMSGPLTIANLSYKIAEDSIWQFILFIGLINVNLAVVNFLPIPILDGGHMVFLIYEKIRGKPAPERMLEIALYIGLAMILSLMAFVFYLDVTRLWF